jgi:cell wall-associated NlpC family hydrolase
MTEQAQRAAVVAEALSWVGTPYHHMGRIKRVGVDCAMLPAEVYAACGLIPRQQVGFYPMDWHLHRSGERYLQAVLAHAHEVEKPAPGDLVLFRFGRAFAHGAIVVAWPNVVHAVVRCPVTLADVAADADLTARECRFFSLWRE